MPTHQGHVYVLGVLAVRECHLESCEKQLREAAKPRDRIHFSESKLARRRFLIDLVANLPVRSTAIIAMGSSRSEERSRRRILAHLFVAADGEFARSESVVFERRGNALDMKDKALIRILMGNTTDRPRRVRHEGWRDQPMLWAADVVAGAVSRAVAADEQVPFPVIWI